LVEQITNDPELEGLDKTFTGGWVKIEESLK
jgi:hypothetical protein